MIIGYGESHLKAQFAIAIDLHQFRETAPNRKRWRTTCGVTPMRAEMSSPPAPRSSARFLKALELVGGTHVFVGQFSPRLISCGSFAVSTMQRIGSVFLISFRFNRRS